MFCIPYFVVAQLGRRLARWLPVAWAVGAGCYVAAAGMLGMSQLESTTPFWWPLLLAGVILAAAGVVGLRGLRHLQMPGSSQPQTTGARASR